MSRFREFVQSRQGMIALGSVVAIAVSLGLDVAGASPTAVQIPLVVIVVVGGVPLVWDIVRDLIARTPGADLLAAIAIVTAVLLDEWLVAAIIVLMLSGGEALEHAATARASRVLEALAKRAPTMAHVFTEGDQTTEVNVADIQVGDRILVLPHEVCPVDGQVVSGHGSMDESYLTGEPYVISKSVGSRVLSGAINGENALVIEATHTAADSRYAQIVGVLAEAEENRPKMRRMADRIGAWYTVLALAMGILGWLVSSDPERFLSVMVIATPCPLLIAVPVAIVGAISLAARSAIIIKDPGVLERIPATTTMMFDKTGTLTYGRPRLTEVDLGPGFTREEVLRLAGSMERYSRHPLAGAVLDAARTELGEDFAEHVEQLAEKPGAGLTATVAGRRVQITSRSKAADAIDDPSAIPPEVGAMESVMIVDGRYAATLRFRDEPRVGTSQFIDHLGPRHGVTRTMLISGDTSSEVAYLAERVGIADVHAGASPERKLELVLEERQKGPVLFLGDGINDAPAMAAADVGIAFGQESDVTTEAAGAVILDSSLERLDELLHIGERMRRIALQSAVGGIALSMVGMVLAVAGMLPPLLGAAAQEAIDLLAILNAVRVVAVRRPLADYHEFVTPEPRRPAPEVV